MKRPSKPALTPSGTLALDQYAHALQIEQDLRPATLRNYLSDLRQFIAWYEAHATVGQDAAAPFAPAEVTTPALTAYRAYLQHEARLQPASINRHLVSLKRYFAWALEQQLVARDPAKPVKLVPQVVPPPRNLTDQEEHRLLAAVQTHGTPRDHAIVITLLHTGLRNDELCGLKREHLKLSKRGGSIRVYGKRNKYREVPLNATARAELENYLKTLPADVPYLFPSQKGELVDATQPEDSAAETAVSGSSAGAPVRRPAPIQPRALGYLIAKYAKLAKVVDLSPHDLRHRFGYRMARTVPLHRLAQIMGHDSLDTTMVYGRGTQQDLQQAVEEIAWT